MSAENSPSSGCDSQPAWMSLAAELIETVAPRFSDDMLWDFEFANAGLTNVNLAALDPNDLLLRAVNAMATGRELGLLDDNDERLVARMYGALVDHAVKNSKTPRSTTERGSSGAELLGETLGQMRKKKKDDEGLADDDSEPPAHKRDPSSSSINASGNAGGVSFEVPVWTTTHGAPFPKTVEAIVRRVGDERLSYLLKHYEITNLNFWLQQERTLVVCETLQAWRRWLTVAGQIEVLDLYNGESPDFRTGT
ncbi:hypothetical protein [Nocardioides sp. WS12]|uniref:hypothetical protein n=1 Tax=Nocardioides sp. WS12 TaxID=2486272 RepID=UPI0015F952DB|nr:hypothetical protein [Nocardioides sp. WS12]